MRVIFEEPAYLVLSVLIVILISSHYLLLRIIKKEAIPFANYETLSRISRKYVFTQNNHQLFIRCITIALIIFALAGATLVTSPGRHSPYTVIMVDASESMALSNGTYSGLGRAKSFIDRYMYFHEGLSKVAIITFSTYSVVSMPLQDNLPYIFINYAGKVREHGVSGTDIGTSLINAVEMLKPYKAARRVIIVTDGQGSIGTSLLLALQVCLDNNARADLVLTPASGMQEADDKNSTSTLEYIAQKTGGEVLRLSPAPSAKSEDNSILALAKPDSNTVYFSLGKYLIIIALAIITLEWSITKGIYKTIPHDR